VPGLAVRFCCRDGKNLTLAKILETFPNVNIDGTATRVPSDALVEDESFFDVFESY